MDEFAARRNLEAGVSGEISLGWWGTMWSSSVSGGLAGSCTGRGMSSGVALWK